MSLWLFDRRLGLQALMIACLVLTGAYLATSVQNCEPLSDRLTWRLTRDAIAH